MKPRESHRYRPKPAHRTPLSVALVWFFAAVTWGSGTQVSDGDVAPPMDVPGENDLVFLLVIFGLLATLLFFVWFANRRITGLNRRERELVDLVSRQTHELVDKAAEVNLHHALLRGMNEASRVQSIADGLLVTAMNLFKDAECGLLMVRDSGRRQLRIAANQGFRQAGIQDRLFEFDEILMPFAGSIGEIGDGIFTIRPVPGQEYSDLTFLPTPRFALALSLQVRGRLFGLLILVQDFDPGELSLATVEKLKRLQTIGVTLLLKIRFLQRLSGTHSRLEETN